MRTIDYSTAFKKDLKRFRHDTAARMALEAAVTLLVAPLPVSARDHALIGTWAGYRDYHLRPDLLLIYRKDGADRLLLARLGSHSDLFN